MKPVLEYEFKVEKDGKVIGRGKGVSRSFVKNFVVLLQRILTSKVTSFKADDGSPKTPYKEDLSLIRIEASEGTDTYGVVVGKDATAPAPDDYKVNNKISHGDGDNLLHYNAVSVGDITVEGTTIKFEITRQFTNNGSVDVTVYEVGLLFNIEGETWNVLIARDVVGGGITVPAGATLTWKYIVRVSV